MGPSARLSRPLFWACFFFPFRKAGTSATFPTPVKVPCSLSRVVNMDDRTYLNEKNESMDLFLRFVQVECNEVLPEARVLVCWSVSTY